MQLNQSVEKQIFYMENQQIKEFFEEDNYFHRLLYLFAGREESCRIVSDIMTHFDRIRTMTLHANPHQGLIREHQEWIAAIEEKNAEKATVLIDGHMGNYEKNMEATRRRYASYFK